MSSGRYEAMNTRRDRVGGFTLVGLMMAAGLAFSGCGSPLGSSEADLGNRPPPERLRKIDRFPAEQYEKPPAPPAAPDAKPEDPSKAARDKFAAMPEVPMTIEEARASALEHNLDLKVSLLSPTITQESVTAEEAAFEAIFTTRALFRESESAVLTGPSTRDDLLTVTPGVTIPLRTGGSATVGLPLSRDENNSAFNTTNPTYGSDVEFSITQPLLRGAGREVNATAISIASYNQQISEAQTKLAVITQIAAVDRAYWRLYQARRDLEVRQQQYELAQAQLEKAQRLVNSGKRAEIEVVRAQSGVADRLEAIIVAQNAVLKQQREFKRLVNLPGLEVDNTSRLITKTDPRPVEYLFNAQTLSASAEQSRMEMMELELQLLADSAVIKQNKNLVLPQLDLTAGYTVHGLGDSFSSSTRMLGRDEFDDWSIGANLAIPLGNEGAQARYRQAVLTRIQRIGSRESRKQTIKQEVYDAVDSIEAGWQRILATRQATILGTRTLQAEQRQFEVGNSTSTNVLDAAARLAEAQLNEITAITDYELAQVNLAVATGTLLGAQHIRWDPSKP